MSEKQKKKKRTLVQMFGGRKSMAFYACLACMMTLALMDRAQVHILSLIDTLFLVYAGANVARASVTKTNDKEEA